MKPWAVYTRVSSSEQAEHGVSLAMQLTSCRAYLTAHGLAVGVEIEDAGHSAKSLKRPGMKRLLEMIVRGEVGGVIAWKLDRLSRSVRDLWDLIEKAEAARVAVACVQEKIDTSGPFGRFAVTMMGAIAQLEREQIAERVTGAIRHIKAKGGFAGGCIPVGLRSVGTKGNRRLELDPATATAMAKVWPMARAGASLRTIAAYLNATVKTRRGKGWSANTISDYLRAPSVVGLLVTREEQAEAVAALGLRKGPRAGAPRPDRAARVYLLAGLAFCAHCGAAMVSTFATGRQRRVPYYRCTSNNQRGKAGCRAGLIPADLAEEAVLQAVRAAVDRDGGREILEAWDERAAAARAAVGPLEEERRAVALARDRAQQQVARLIDGLALGEASARAIQAALERSQAEVEASDLRLAGIDARLAAGAVTEGNAAAAHGLMREAVARLEGATPQEQADGLRTMLRRCSLAIDVPRVDLELVVDAAGSVRTGRSKWRRGSNAVRTEDPLVLAVSVPVRFARHGSARAWRLVSVGGPS